jgi:hypothetical protein
VKPFISCADVICPAGLFAVIGLSTLDEQPTNTMRKMNSMAGKAYFAMLITLRVYLLWTDIDCDIINPPSYWRPVIYSWTTFDVLLLESQDNLRFTL